MKQALLAIIIVACFSSAVLTAGLARVYVIVNMPELNFLSKTEMLEIEKE